MKEIVFITLHSTYNGTEWLVNVDCISVIGVDENRTKVFLKGEDAPLVVTETPKQIVKLIKSINQTENGN